MLSLTKCRKLLGGVGSSLTDGELESLRSQLYSLADAVTSYNTKSEHVPPADRAWAALPDGDREDVEERAAVLEFDGGFGRDVAERIAVRDYLHRGERN